MGEALRELKKCSKCGASIHNPDSICIVCKEEVITNTQGVFKPIHAGFWLRIAAYLIDGLVVGMVIEIYNSFFGFNYYLAVGFYFAYKVFLECSKYQGTLGKGIMGLKVINYKGERISFDQSVRRYIGHVFSFMIFALGFVMIVFTPNKQGIQDFLAKTYVVKT